MAHRTISARTFALVACESLFIYAAIALAASIRIGEDARAMFSGFGLAKALIIATVCQLSL